MESLDYGDVEVATDAERANTVTMLIAHEYYRGQTPQGLHVGMHLAEVTKRVGPLTYVSDFDSWRFDGHERIYLEVSRPPQPGEDPIDPPYCTEVYEFQDREHAFVRAIYLISPG